MPLQVKCGVRETALVQAGSKTRSLLSSVVPVPLERRGAAQGAPLSVAEGRAYSWPLGTPRAAEQDWGLDHLAL